MPPTPIPLALSKEEWAQHGCIRSPNVLHARDGETVRNGHYWLDVANSEDDDGTMVAPESRHALAALCLYNQEFGFTQEDVRILRDIAGLDRPNLPPPMAWHIQVGALADRIAALLPPAE